MDFERGYRLRIARLDELTKLLGAYRVHALRIMAVTLAEQTAKTAVVALDASAVGLSQNKGDFLEKAMQSVRSAHDVSLDGVFAPTINCQIGFHIVGSAILAEMTHGSDRYRKPWEARREVVKWGWAEGMARPSHVGEKAWLDRERFWRQVGKTSGAGFGVLRFCLLEEKVPSLAWEAIQRCIPPVDWRVEQCVRKLASAEGIEHQSLSERDRKRFSERARSVIREIAGQSAFSRPQTVEARKEKPAAPPPRAAGRERSRVVDQMASSVDHADIVVASDGRAFMAVPYVGFRAEDRVFVQVGSKDITFTQNGIQYGTVANVPGVSRDYLRGLTSITLVEVIEVEGKRLLRAKHTAMVSDISLGEGLRRPLQTFKRKPRDAGIQEI